MFTPHNLTLLLAQDLLYQHSVYMIAETFNHWSDLIN